MKKYSKENDIGQLAYLIYDSFNQKKFIYGCLDQSILDNDLLLFSVIFLTDRNKKFRITEDTDNILDYAKKACNYKKTKIFEYLIELYSSTYGSDSYDYSYNEDKVKKLTNYLVDNQKNEYLKILKKYKLVDFKSYIIEILENHNSFSSSQNNKSIKRITFIMDNFEQYLNQKDLSSYLYRSTRYHKKVFPSEVLELFENFDFIKKKNNSKQFFEELSSELAPSNPIVKQKKLKV